MVLLFDKKQGGFHDIFSMLETLTFLGFVEVESEKSHIGFTLKFKKNNIVPTTFDQAKVESTLEEDEDAPVARRNGGSRKDPGFKHRSEWPKFYEQHKADCDLLWQAALNYALNCEGLESGVQLIEDETPVIPIDTDEENETETPAE